MCLCVCDICGFRETMDLCPKSYADGGTGSVMSVHDYTGAIRANARKDNLTRCFRVAFFHSNTLLHDANSPFHLSSLQPSGSCMLIVEVLFANQE